MALARIISLAYGSNLHPFRLTHRVPSAKLLGVVSVPGKRLAFHKRSDDGSGKCLFYAPGGAEDMMDLVSGLAGIVEIVYPTLVGDPPVVVK